MRTGSTTNAKDKEGVPKVRRKPGRVPTSCAECRRLKLRCDKKVPCEKCVSRGCSSICPEGMLAPGKGNRLILANTGELHEQIEQLCARNRELENALRTMQETVSEEPHPLLKKDAPKPVPSRESRPPPPTLTTMSSSSSTPRSEEPLQENQDQDAQIEDDGFIDAFGTLTLGLRGQTFLGKTARSEYLIRALTHQQPRAIPSSTRLSKRMTEALFPEIELVDSALGRDIYALLPPPSEAIHLCEIYQEYGKYLYAPIPRTELFDEIFANVYRVDCFEALTCYHSLSLLLIVFAIAALFDPDKPPYSVEAQEFFYLSRTTLRFNNQTSRLSIQCIMHMAQYLEFSDWDSSTFNITWLYIGHAVRLAYSAGLHLDSSRWNLSEVNVERRSRLFWQLFHLDTWTSFQYGRPPTLSTVFVDCPSPKDDSSSGDREPSPSFHNWNYQYDILLHSLMSTAFGPKQPAYSVILSLDRRVRDFPVPTVWRPGCHGVDGVHPTPTVLHFQRWMVLCVKESTLLNLHRAYFARALQEIPNELTKHKYIPSVLAIYRSAWRIIEGLRLLWSRRLHPITRINWPWSLALSAAIVMCLLVTRAPTSNMTTPALTELDHLVEIFQEASAKAPAAANLRDSILKLHQKAHDAADAVTSHGSPSSPLDTELDRLGGRTHLLAEVGAPDSGTSGPSESITLTGVEMDLSPDSQQVVDNMHPTLAQDMRSFDTGFPTINFFDFPAGNTQPTVVSQHHTPMSEPHMNGSGYYPSGSYQTYHQHHLPQTSFEQTAPILDATWHSFVEQLGF